MNKIEHLLTCLAEECAEIQKAVAKAQRFGLDNHHPHRTETNFHEIGKEVCHMIAVVSMLEEEIGHVVVSNKDAERITEDKKARVSNYMIVSRNCGTLTDTEENNVTGN